MSESYHFQVNLGGMLDILSNHLYKSPDVFLRELLQNAVDAITMRQKAQPDWRDGSIRIEAKRDRSLSVTDNGAGLSKEEIHQFLAVIGQSSKTQLQNGVLPEDYIGRFGIGLLSCFMVSDDITIYTKSIHDNISYQWRGFPDGTYTLDEWDGTIEPVTSHRATSTTGTADTADGAASAANRTTDEADSAVNRTIGAAGDAADRIIPAGTTVLLHAKPGAEDYYNYDRLEGLIRYYGLALPTPIYFPMSSRRLNVLPGDFTRTSRSQLLAFGRELFGEKFLDAIPIHTKHLDGAAYILPYETATTLKNGHRIYLKHMLLTERGDTLLPPWAFFLQCVLNTRGLRPTASREDFYEDDALLEAREEFARAIATHLADLARYVPERLEKIVRVHEQALKSIAVWDDELFQLFIDYFPFDTSNGLLRGADLKQEATLFYVGTVERFRQLKPIFQAQNRLLICAGYTNECELLNRLRQLCGVEVLPLNETDLGMSLDDLSPDDQEATETFLQVANDTVARFDCTVELKRFLPRDLPSLYLMSDDVKFLRAAQKARDQSDNIFSEVLSTLIDSAADRALSTLYLNLNNPLIQQAADLANTQRLQSMVRILYVQSLMASGFPLHHQELQLMSHELLQLLSDSAEPDTPRLSGAD